jgi:ABC transporter DrrB family efflux protein
MTATVDPVASGAATPVRTRVSPMDAVRDTLVITRRNLRRNVRLPQLLVLATIQPVMFLLLFNFVFGGAIGRTLPPAAGGAYINWLMPGLILQTLLFGASQTAVGLTEDLASGAIDRFRSLPMARSAVLGGRTLADLGRNTAVMTLLLLVGVGLGFRYQTSLAGLVGGVAIALLFGYAMSWAMATVGLLVRNPEAAQSAVMVPLFPLVFASSIFLPTETMPAWLQAFADHQPITAVADAARGMVLGEGALVSGRELGAQVLVALGWTAGVAAVFAAVAVRLYRRAVQ